ncbi:MAG TPA: hypothetical protein VG621_02235 [Candidatus Paceibacterota bacterium]|nr:hypothetical protein [Candidatus Paceibacterota bacterium]
MTNFDKGISLSNYLINELESIKQEKDATGLSMEKRDALLAALQMQVAQYLENVVKKNPDLAFLADDPTLIKNLSRELFSPKDVGLKEAHIRQNVTWEHAGFRTIDDFLNAVNHGVSDPCIKLQVKKDNGITHFSLRIIC